MNYKKVMLSAATLSLGVSSSVGAVDINENQNGYIKLAAIIPVAELDASVSLSSDRYSDDEMIRKTCVAKGFTEGLDCPPAGEETLCLKERCVDDSSSVGYNYTKCSCYCNGRNTCNEMGYVESCESGYVKNTSDKCPIDNSLYKCITNPCSGYSTSCSSGYTKNTGDTCKSGTTIKYKCVANPCADYKYTSCSTGYTSAGTCQSGSTTKYKCVAAPCNGYDKTSACSPSSGYTQTTCKSGTATKYKCVAKPCTDYKYTSCASGYVSGGTCQAGGTLKYKCVADPCTGYGNTSPCNPISGYTQTTCKSGTATKYKCIAKPCTDYKYTSCASGYVSDGTCQSGGTLKYKCKANPCTDYNYTTCPSGWNPTETCKSGTTTKYKCKITDEQRCKDAGYLKTKCPTDYYLFNKCSYASYYKLCNKTDGLKCREAGYSSSVSSCSKYKKLKPCTYSASYNKCIDKTPAEKCITDGYSSSVTKCADGIIPTPPVVSNEVKCFDRGFIYDKCDNGIAGYCTYKSNLLSCKNDTTSCDSECRSFGYSYGTKAYNCCMGTVPFSNCQIPDYKSGMMQTYQACLGGISVRPDGALGVVNSEAINLGYRPGKLSALLDDPSILKPLPAETLENCSFDANYKKCVPIDYSAQCSSLGFSKSVTSCPSGQKLTRCLMDTSMAKCTGTSNADRCKEDGFEYRKTCGLGELSVKCFYDANYNKCDRDLLPTDCRLICADDYGHDTNGYSCCMGLGGTNCLRYRRCKVSELTECSSTPSLNNARCAELGYSPYINCGSGVFKTSCPCDNTKGYAKCSGGTSQLSLSR